MNEVKFIPALRFNFLTSIYDFVFKLTMPEKKFRNDLVDRFKNSENTKAMEFGVGTASNAILAKQKYPAMQVTGVDVDPKILAMAKKKIEETKTSVTLVAYDGQHLPFADSHFDVVFSSLVFHHLIPKDKVNAFAEINRVLKPGGQFVYADWGKPVGMYNTVVFAVFRIFEGPLNTNDHTTGHYHTMIMNAGFEKASILKKYKTVFGTLELAETFKQMGV